MSASRKTGGLCEGSERHTAFLHATPVVGVLLGDLGREQVVVGGVEERLALQRREDVGVLDLRVEEMVKWDQSRFDRYCGCIQAGWGGGAGGGGGVRQAPQVLTYTHGYTDMTGMSTVTYARKNTQKEMHTHK